MSNRVLEGKVALVTGAGRGIGRTVAFGLAEHGAEVTLCARTATEIEAAAEEIRKAGGRAETIVQDVTDVGAFAQAIAAQPAFDVVVNNAGTNRPKPLSDVTIDDYLAVMDLNLKAVVFVTQAEVERVVETAESIVEREAAMAASLRDGKPISEVMGANYEQMLKRQNE